MFVSAIKLAIFTWGSMGLDSLLEPASRGHSRNCTSALALFFSSGGCRLGPVTLTSIHLILISFSLWLRGFFRSLSLVLFLMYCTLSDGHASLYSIWGKLHVVAFGPLDEDVDRLKVGAVSQLEPIGTVGSMPAVLLVIQVGFWYLVQVKLDIISISNYLWSSLLRSVVWVHYYAMHVLCSVIKRQTHQPSKKRLKVGCSSLLLCLFPPSSSSYIQSKHLPSVL